MAQPSSHAGYGSKGTSMKKLDLPAAIAARFEVLPPKLSVPQVAEFFQEKISTTRQQIRRGSFLVTVRQVEGGEQYILLADLIRFCIDGVPQTQALLVKRAARNPFGRNGKLGRPTNKERAIREAGIYASKNGGSHV